ncbi:MAG: enoyl-CoA hydratase/isomerase family protein [Myxococcales bacterium]|nr:enoyl-CoA hydratase/isomerase family protein [Myxococcales bacterium]
MTAFESLLVNRRGVADGEVVTLTLNRPQRKNALSPALVNELLHALAEAQASPAVRVIVLDGAGGHFCAGADLSGGAGDGSLPVRGDFADLLLAITESPVPVVARLRGVVMGGGVGLAAASHFAYAAESAVFSTPEVHRGLWPMMIMAVLARTVSRRHLLELMLLGEKFSASHAVSIGLINRVCTDEALDEAVEALAASLAGRSPTAVTRGLRAWAAQGDLSLREALPMLRDALFELFSTDDAREGLAAFLEKRAPRWSGR